jgi:Isochorismate synthase
MTDEKIAPVEEEIVIKNLIEKAFAEGDSVVLWRLPNQPEKNLILSKAILELEDFELQELPPGFIVAPFLSTKTKLFFKADNFYSIKDGVVQEGITPEVFFHNEPEHSSQKSGKNYHTKHLLGKEVHSYTEIVAKAIQEIESGALEKIVPSRYKDINLPQDFDLLKTFNRLADRYPNALISIVSSPKVGTWMGATPELLVSMDDQMIFRTVALAGTLPYQESMNLKTVAWTQKEIEEQALVTRYIINCFKKIRLREYEEHGPKTVIAGNLLHLKTEYSVDVNAVNFPNLCTVMLKLLHPTSAVCGMPLQNSISFLKENEGYDRELYSGFLGPVNIQNCTSVFVNLRCMQLFKNEARLYAGAGVTIDSNPEMNSLKRI